MPFLIAFAIALHLMVFGPLYLVFNAGDQFELSPWSLLGWPLLASLTIAAIVGWAVKIAAARGFARPLAILAAIGVYLYLQFYGFIWDFGIFDGRNIEFSSFRDKAIIEGTAFVALVAAALVWPRAVTPLFGRFLAILLAASAGFGLWELGSRELALLNSQDQGGVKSEGGIASSNFFRDDLDVMRNITRVSKQEKNVIVLLLDTLQVDVFENVVLKDPDLRRQFSGFQLFTNTTGHFPYTSLSVPAILTGEPYTAGQESIPEYRKRIASKRVEAVLSEQGAEASRVQLESRRNFINGETAACRSYGNVYDFFGFRQLPVILKPVFYDEGRFRFARLCGQVPATESEVDLAVFSKLVNDTVADARTPTIKYIHFWGAHPPASLTPECQPRARIAALTEFQGQAHCMLRQVGAYLDKLRSLGVFDNTMMFVISDHGSRLGFLKKSPNADVPFYVMSSATPSLAFHDFGDNKEFRINESPAMLADIYPTILAGFGQAAGGVGIDLHQLAKDETRERPFLFYKGSGDVKNDFLPQVERFKILGDVRDPMAWSRDGESAKSQANDLPLGKHPMGSYETSKHLGIGWSAEAEGVPASWVISNPASVSGRLPDAKAVRFSLRLLNPHSDQTIVIKLNGRELGEWSFPQPTPWVDRSLVFTPTAEEAGKPVRIDIDVGKIGPLKSDLRTLGIGVKMIAVQPADGAVPSDSEPQLAVNDALMGRLPLNDPATRDFFNDAWTIEDPSVKASWVVRTPAVITGQLPTAHSIRLNVRLMNPHKNQTVLVKLNGREIGQWDLPEPTAWVEKSLVFTPTSDDLKRPARIEFDVGKIEQPSAADIRKLGIAAEIVTFQAVD